MPFQVITLHTDGPAEVEDFDSEAQAVEWLDWYLSTNNDELGWGGHHRIKAGDSVIYTPVRLNEYCRLTALILKISE